MDKTSYTEDRLLVKQCMAGSESAWSEFYSRFVGLMRAVVKKHGARSPQDIEDVTQSAFLALTSALSTYDAEQSLARFVCLVTERVLIDEYRKSKAAKRDCQTESLDRSDSAEQRHLDTSEDSALQDELMERAQLASRLRVSLRSLDGKCRELLTLRYMDERSFKEIAEQMGASENTVTVQTRRCLDSLKIKFKQSDRREPVR
jgi:RNA polymerase sigma factor (sigma-70 family)